jgi:hypothetical protein
LSGLRTEIQNDDFFHVVYDLSVDDFVDGDGKVLMFQLMYVRFDFLQ